MYDRLLTYPRLLKTCIALAQIALLVLSYRIFTNGFQLAEASTALGISAFWLALTWVRLGGLLRTYYDHLSRLQVVVPTALGIALTFGAAYASCKLNMLGLGYLAAAVFAGWNAVILRYVQNKALYKKQGHGPVPKETWVCPAAEALRPGDLILTSGRMAGRLHDTVGHAELVIADEGTGRLHTLTSYMETGTRVNRLDAVIQKLNQKGIHYIALRLKTPLTAEQNSHAVDLAERYSIANSKWRDKLNKRRARIISWLPLPQAAKDWLLKKTHATGYDWSGLFIGTRATDHWTCIAICIACLKEIGVPVGDYGTGILGLGTGLLDPIQPVRLLGDKAYRLVSLDDKARFESKKG